MEDAEMEEGTQLAITQEEQSRELEKVVDL